MAQFGNDQLKKTFHQEMITLYKRVLKELKYKSPRLMDLINKYGGYEAAVKYITTESNVQNFAVLWENQRLDLSVEALITKTCYRELFTEDIISFCDRKLEQYSYAPNEVEEEEEDTGYIIEGVPLAIEDDEVISESEVDVPQLPYTLYHKAPVITQEMWEEALENAQLVSPKNRDLLLRIYLIGDQVTPEELAKEEGYLATYPYNEVATALAKRLKAYFKVTPPVDEDGKILWWHLLFVGGMKDNKAFEWSLRSDLRKAIEKLIQTGRLTTDNINVQTQKTLQGFEEAPMVKPAPITVEEVKREEKQDTLSDFDRLFEAIMMPSPSKEEPQISKMTSSQTVEPSKMNVELVKEPVEIQEDRVDSCPVTHSNQEEVIQQVKVESSKEEVKEASEEEIKKACIDYYGAICDICGFDYGYTYGDQYEMCIDVHNVKHSGEKEVLPTTHPIEDLVPICHNCHHILHSQTPELTIEQMRALVKA